MCVLFLAVNLLFSTPSFNFHTYRPCPQDGRKGLLAHLTGNGMTFTVSLQIGINTGWVVESILGKRLLPRYKLFGKHQCQYAVLFFVAVLLLVAVQVTL